MATIGFTCGAFDLLHAGHMLMFAECKEHCDYLIVGLHEDPSQERQDKNTPVQTLTERVVMLEGIRYVDEIIVYRTEENLRRILEETPIDIRFVGEDWRGKPVTGGDLEIPLHYTNRDHGYSSRELRRQVFEAELAARREV